MRFAEYFWVLPIYFSKLILKYAACKVKSGKQTCVFGTRCVRHALCCGNMLALSGWWDGRADKTSQKLSAKSMQSISEISSCFFRFHSMAAKNK